MSTNDIETLLAEHRANCHVCQTKRERQRLGYRGIDWVNVAAWAGVGLLCLAFWAFVFVVGHS